MTLYKSPLLWVLVPSEHGSVTISVLPHLTGCLWRPQSCTVSILDMCYRIWWPTQSYQGRKFNTHNSRDREESEEKHGSQEAGATGHDMCSRFCISKKREAGVTHIATQRFSSLHLQTDKSCLKIESENLFKESISSTILFPREDKIYTRPVINQFHKTLETLVREFAKCWIIHMFKGDRLEMGRKH